MQYHFHLHHNQIQMPVPDTSSSEGLSVVGTKSWLAKHKCTLSALPGRGKGFFLKYSSFLCPIARSTWILSDAIYWPVFTSEGPWFSRGSLNQPQHH